MNCKNCYQEIPDGSKFCPHCGAKQNEVQPNAEQENAVKNDPVQATGASKIIAPWKFRDFIASKSFVIASFVTFPFNHHHQQLTP